MNQDMNEDQNELNNELDDNLDLNQELESTDEEVSAEPTPTADVEVQEAKKHGHLSEDDYLKKYGSLKGYKSPQEFNKFGKEWTEVSDVIKGVQKQLSERDKQIEALVKYNERIEERAMQAARRQLEQQLADAKAMGNVQAVEQLSREKAKAEFHENQEAQQKHEAERFRVEHSFREANKHWLGINQTMTARVHLIDAEEREKAAANNINMTYDQLAKVVTARMRVEFPEEMISQNTGNSAPSLSVRDSQVNKPSDTGLDGERAFKGLSQEQIDIFNITNNSLKRMKLQPYTKQAYIDKLRNRGEI